MGKYKDQETSFPKTNIILDTKEIFNGFVGMCGRFGFYDPRHNRLRVVVRLGLDLLMVG